MKKAPEPKDTTAASTKRKTRSVARVEEQQKKQEEERKRKELDAGTVVSLRRSNRDFHVSQTVDSQSVSIVINQSINRGSHCTHTFILFFIKSRFASRGQHPRFIADSKHFSFLQSLTRDGRALVETGCT